ncbi:hypothetical protein [Actinocorallia sp. A-T 12471]|uniref:hypothetical protein n=1 Tax=Actinocorallia sp. A-T 12471 TaxID=3089813 RepID=UPI0029CF34E5|nr:hypothetical protein [Actinocorallia sp. A-T 12471]MDX6741716.1 hypothetical protein [Actinocorallia sp. A-T 12471]
MTRTDRDELAILWAEHRGRTFPDDLKFTDGLDDTVLLDLHIAGAVMNTLRGDRLPPFTVGALKEGITLLRRSFRKIPKGPARPYAARLIQMSTLALNEHYRAVRG